jgi:hypothetical protein
VKNKMLSSVPAYVFFEELARRLRARTSGTSDVIESSHAVGKEIEAMLLPWRDDGPIAAETYTTAKVAEDYEVDEAEALEWATANNVQRGDSGQFVWSAKNTSDFDEHIVNTTPHICDVCEKETLDSIEGKWVSFHIINGWPGLAIDVCDECAKSDEKLKEGLEVFIDHFRRYVPDPP